MRLKIRKATRCKLKVGDTVALKSSHVPMSIDFIEDDGMVSCVCVTQEGVFEHKFPAELLVFLKRQDWTGT